MRDTADREPQARVAVIGMSCRLPGADGPAEFWRLLRDGIDAVGEPPPGRPGPGGPSCRGGYIAGVDMFDADFFGISPAEAAALDPQHRLALELAWEAVEHARIAPDRLRDSATGVYLAAIGHDYALLADRAARADRHTFTGTLSSLLANRVSYFLGLRGPSLTVDTGQSSSLVAIQLACEALGSGRIDTALAGGVNLTLLQETTDRIGRIGALSPDGRCFTFDERANGYVRGEGGGIVVLRRLADAQADGDPVHAVILGGAITHDGGGPGLIVPAESGQREAITLACAAAGVAPTAVRYVELHGTGTPVGDPVEAAALGHTLGAGRPADDPLLVGSVKTNIGHLEGAAGIAGLLKVVLSLAHRRLPATLNHERPPATIPLAALGLRVVRAAREWPGPAGPLLAGVSSFGVGGTNCHLILADGDAVNTAPAKGDATAQAWLVSGRSAAALAGQAARLAGQLRAQPADPADVVFSLAHTRAHLEHRAVVLGTRATDLLAGVDALAADRPDPAVVPGRVTPGRCAFVFPGEGTQWPGMAETLIAEHPVFARTIADCADALRPYIDYDLIDVLTRAPGAAGLDRVDVVQPALWAVMVSLAAVWRSAGVEPDLVIGPSQGEIAAATVAGALDPADAARVVALRSRAVTAVSGGGMLSISAPTQLVLDRIAERGHEVYPAVFNGPSSIVVSGSYEALGALQRELDADGRRTRLLPVHYASHSPAVDPLRATIRSQLAPIRPRAAGPTFVSTVTGAPFTTTGLDADYWFANLRQPVRFADAVGSALAAGARLFVACSPHPALLDSIREIADLAGHPVTAVGTLRRDHGGMTELRRNLAAAWTGGATVDPAALAGSAGGRAIDLPTYAFQRRRHWLDTAADSGRPTTAPPAVPVTQTMTAAQLRDLVSRCAGAVLGYAEGEPVAPNRSFRDLGLDSAGSTAVVAQLRLRTGLPLPVTTLYDFPTARQLADHLGRLLAAG
ncbi:MAG TPA: acyltransferase domain-containing protein [Jatrophihabitans sp.]|nr:acyltransferase domain-containing protein [Jatrophihabitans sp.]